MIDHRRKEVRSQEANEIPRVSICIPSYSGVVNKGPVWGSSATWECSVAKFIFSFGVISRKKVKS